MWRKMKIKEELSARMNNNTNNNNNNNTNNNNTWKNKLRRQYQQRLSVQCVLCNITCLFMGFLLSHFFTNHLSTVGETAQTAPKQQQLITTAATTATAAATAAAANKRTFEEENEWIRHNFNASNAALQEWCVSALLGDKPSDSQFGQDIFIIRNLYLHKIITMSQSQDNNNKQHPFFYIEAGANHYKKGSTTFFFDHCLGWDGLCVEPQQQYHRDILKHRSCTLVPNCISPNQNSITMMVNQKNAPSARMEQIGTTTKNQTSSLPDGYIQVECLSFETIMQRNKRNHVDLFVLDVEGMEATILDSIKWNNNNNNDDDFIVTVDAFLIEDNKAFGRRLDYDMNMRGYAKYHQLAIDSLYTKFELLSDYPSSSPSSHTNANLRKQQQQQKQIWYSPTWTTYEELCEMTGDCRRDCPVTAAASDE